MEQLKFIENENGKGSENIKLTKRDYEILQFVLEMKFSGIEEIYQKFFKVKKNGELSKSDCWARDRVLQLQKRGFLKAITFYSEAKLFYVTTYKAFHVLKDRFSDRHFCYPNKDIDVRTFYHDWLVTKCRLQLEEEGLVKRWWSEKYIKSETRIVQGLPRKYMPDAVYETHDGKRVAFELEKSLKARSRYRDKIQLYFRLMSSPKNASGSFQKCHYVCQKDKVFEILERQSKPFGNLFQVEMLDRYKGTEHCLKEAM